MIVIGSAKRSTGVSVTVSLLTATLCLVSGQDARASACAPVWRERVEAATQAIVVEGDAWHSLKARVRVFERRELTASWREVTSPFIDLRATVGRNGLGWGVGFTSFASVGEPHKREGDGKTPVGVFSLGTRFGFAPPASGETNYLQLKASTECVDDIRSIHYDRIVDRTEVVSDWTSSEKMSTIDVYREGVDVRYNPYQVRSGGSCIFIHHWEDHEKGTSGCVAMNPAAVRALHEWLTGPGVLMILPDSQKFRVQSCLK